MLTKEPAENKGAAQRSELLPPAAPSGGFCFHFHSFIQWLRQKPYFMCEPLVDEEFVWPDAGGGRGRDQDRARARNWGPGTGAGLTPSQRDNEVTV